MDEPADVVLVSHDHGDHTGGKVGGNPTRVASSGKSKAAGIEFTGIATYHDTSEGSERGPNLVFCFTIDGIRICHLGDLGHDLSETQVGEIGSVDVLIIPVGGVFTIDAAVATSVCDRIRPRVIIPMHYKTDKCDFPIAGVEEFIKGKTNVKKAEASEIELSREGLPKDGEIIVLKHAL